MPIAALSRLDLALRRLAFTALALLALTAVHHAYGAYVFDTIWRLHILIPASVVAIAIMAGLRLARAEHAVYATGGRWLTAAAALIFPIVLIGVWEGGYNHLIKNLVYFSAGADFARTVFPAPTYEMPGDVFFEVSGVAQFGLALYGLWQAIKAVGALAGGRSVAAG